MSESRGKLNLLFEKFEEKQRLSHCHLIIYVGLSTAKGARTNQIAEHQGTLKKVGGVTG